MRVLLIEDDSATAASIEMMLRSEGFICDTTDLGEDGLEIGKLYDYDIIVLDLMLPDLDGYEVLRRLRAARVRHRFSSSPASPSSTISSRPSALAPTTSSPSRSTAAS